MNCYIDSSAFLRCLLNREDAGRRLSAFTKIGSSELTLIECSRVLERYRLENLVTDEQLAETREALQTAIGGLFLFEISAAVKRRASESFPTVIGTLDAIHLATALLWHQRESAEDLVLFSYDRQMITCARAMGLSLHAGL
jgi:predicted nucleic acid-binding protein